MTTVAVETTTQQQDAPPTPKMRHMGCMTCYPDGVTFTTFCGITKPVEGTMKRSQGECVVCRDLGTQHTH